MYRVPAIHHRRCFTQSTPSPRAAERPPFGFRSDMGLDQKKRIGVHTLKSRFLAGSPTNGEPWHFRKPPQSPPQKAPLVKLAVKAEIKPPTCPHGMQLTSEEYEANCYAFGRLRMKDRPVSFETVL